MTNSRDQIIETTCNLLESQGYHATGLNQIIRESRSPRGSLYYYFPDGKEELAAEAIERTGRGLADRIRANLDRHADPAQAIPEFINIIASAVESSGFSTGGPLTTVALETATSSPRINLACRESYARIQSAFAEKLTLAGLADEDAAHLAEFIVAAIEGGIILSRTRHTGDPLRRVAGEIGFLLRAQRR